MPVNAADRWNCEGTIVARNRWDEFGKKNAEYYILTSDVDYGTTEGMAYFFESGRREVEVILNEVGDRLTTKGTALEVGCGVGRLALAMADTFDRVIGVDIAPSMLEKLAKNIQDAGVHNVVGFLADAPWEEEGPIDFVYSRLVFQHIEDHATIETYIRRIASCLHRDGIASLQFDTRPRSFPYQVRQWVPDHFLPRPWRRGIRRVRRAATDLERLFEEHGLTISAQLRPDSANHVFIVTKA